MTGSFISKELEAELSLLEEKGLRRSLLTTAFDSRGKLYINNRQCIDFSSNDYLGLSQHPGLKEAAASAIKTYGVGGRASRLMTGNLDLYRKLEEKVAHLKGTEECLVFGSGYLCNLSVISTIIGPSDCIVMDKLCHASIVDGALLSRARIIRFPHNDTERLEAILKEKRGNYKRLLIAVESLYSMDGDISPISRLVRLASKYSSILMVDEAHAVGLFGQYGEGLVARDTKEKPDLIIGTFGKALGGYGAFCATGKAFKEILINRARGLIYSTALPPSTLASNLKGVELLPKLQDERQRVLDMAHAFRHFVANRLGLKTRGNSQIVPLILKDVSQALSLEDFLRQNNILAKAIRPPTVPKDSPRIRFSFCAYHDKNDITLLQDLLEKFFKEWPNR